MKLNVPTVGAVQIDFEYIRIPRTIDTSFNGGPFFSRTVSWKLKTICKMRIGEIEHIRWVWKSAPHEHDFNLREERKRALTEAMRSWFPASSWRGICLVNSETADNRKKRRAIWAALHAAGFHPFPVSKVDRLTKLLEQAKKRAKKREGRE